MPELLGYQFDRTFALPIERYRQVSTIAERDAIPTGKRWRGMLCYVTGEDNDYQLRGGITNGDWVAASAGNYFDLANNDSDDITEGVINLFLTNDERTKLSFITITQAVDLDALETAVAALGSGLAPRGGWDASSGSFPGGGTAQIGDFWFVTVAGTVDGIDFAKNETIVALAINASTTTFAGNWFKGEVTNAVTSVVGLTGAISKSALLAALNVEDGATADMTGSEISAAITSFLTSADWQTKLTNEEVLDFVGAAINSGTQTKITVEYDDTGGVYNFTVDPFIIVYADLATLVAAQGSQVDDIAYEVTDASGFTGVTSGRAWVRYKGTTVGDETDYIIMSKEESVSQTAPIPLTYADLATLVAGQGSQILNFIYEVSDGSGFTGVSSGAIWVKYLGTITGDETDYRIVSRAVTSGSGDVVGPASATDNAVARYDTTTGKLLQDSVVTASDTGAVAGVTTLDLNQVRPSKGADVASATALPILTDGNSFNVTGTTTITSINTTGKVGTVIKLRFDAILVLTHHVTDLILPTGANITTQAGDEVEFLEYAEGDFRCTSYLRADGMALAGGGSGTTTVTADTSTVISLANNLGNLCNMGSANATTTYTTTGEVDGGWAQVLINTALEPTVTGATKEIGATWVIGTDMYLNVSYNGTEVSYFFSHYIVNTDTGDLVEDTTPQLGGELDTNGHSVGGTPQSATGDGTTTIDWKLGNIFNFQFGAFNEVFTFTAPSKPGTFILKLVQDSVGSRTATWPATVKWTSGAAPTLTTTATTGTDIITFYYDGTSYFAVQSLNFS